MLKNLSIALILIHLSFSLGDLASSMWTANNPDLFSTQQASLPDDRESQETPELKDLNSEYCAKNTLGIALPYIANLITIHYIDHSAPWLIQTEGEIQTPPPDLC